MTTDKEASTLDTAAVVLLHPDLSELLAHLATSAERFAVQHALGNRRTQMFRSAVEEYQSSFEAVLRVHPDREIILAYARAGTIFAQHSKDCAAATVGILSPSQLGKTRSLFAAWRSCERTFVQAGYRSIDFTTLYNSTYWAGVSKKIEFLIYNSFFVRMGESEDLVFHADAMLSINPSLANPELLIAGDEVVAWEGSRLVLGQYVEPIHGEHLIRAGRRDFLSTCLIRLSDAVDSGIWPFVEGLQVVAFFDGAWCDCTWLGYEGDLHIVEFPWGQETFSSRAHSYEDGVAMGLLLQQQAA